MNALTQDSDIPELAIREVASVRLALGPAAFPHAEEQRPAIEAAWAARRAKNAALFNGRFFLLVGWRLTDEGLDGTCAETDYASYLHWREAGFPGSARNAFAMAALHAADGRLLIGRMASWTANAGVWYPPAGSLEAEDLTEDARLDLDGNIRRELEEEIGLTLTSPLDGPWTLVFARGRLAMFRAIRLAKSAEAIEAEARAAIARQTMPELDDIRFVASAAELNALNVPPFLTAYARRVFGA